jgi:ferrous iron transport protein A
MNKTIRLCDLRDGEVASVKEIYPKCRIRQRLFDVGLIEGTRVECVFKSPIGGMKAYLIRGAVIAIRDEDCQSVSVDTEDSYGTD